MGLVIEDDRLKDCGLELRRDSAIVTCPGITYYGDGCIELDYDYLVHLEVVTSIIREKLTSTPERATGS